ncbi:hypothetical protein KKF91_06570 [Myxococcota bacterium]|nr:hypothetical protein [Myxococcota bacterium]MBU1430218.1 hypothetical protein [Myxococcota bacterium]
MRHLTPLALLLTPALLGWTVYGEGLALWSAGEGQIIAEGQRVPLDVLGRVTPDEVLHLEATLPLRADRGDGVLAVYMDDRLRNLGRVALPNPRVEIRYREYDPYGDLLFVAALESARGYARLDGYGERDLILQLDLRGEDGAAWRRFELVEMHVRAVNPELDDALQEGHVVANSGGGCDDGYDDNSGYEDEGYGHSSGGGCEGDDLDDGGGADTSSDGGCEGDDFDSGSEGADPGCDCEGDAVAARRGVYQRSPWIVRALNWTPWLLIYLFIQGLKRGRRRAMR